MVVKLRPLKTSDIAEYCGVSHFTVINWIKEGKLKAYTTPGGHYRVQKEEFRRFLEEYGIPVEEEFFIEHPKRVLIVDDEPEVVEFIIKALEEEGWEFASSDDGFETGFLISTFQPDLIILDLLMSKFDNFETCRRVKENPATKQIKVLAVTDRPEHVERAKKCGADDCLVKPLKAERLRRKARRLLR